MNTPEDVGGDAGVDAGEPGEKTADEVALALSGIGAGVLHRLQTGSVQTGFNHRLGEVIKRANDNNFAGEKWLGGQNRPGGGGEKEIKQKCFVDILQVMSEGDLVTGKFIGGFEERLASFPGTEKTGFGFCFL